MIITGASLLGQILTNRTSPGILSAKAPPAPAEAVPRVTPEPASTPAPVTMSLSTLDALFALQAGTAAPTDTPPRTVAPAAGADAGPPRTRARTAVDPDLVRAIAAALDSRKDDGAGPTATGPRSTVVLETSVSRESSLREALEMAGRAEASAADPQGRAAFH